MAEVSAHKEGMPAWVELATSDAEGALRFYGALLGWEDDPQPMGPDMVHHMQRLRGLEVGGIYQQGAGEKAQGFPPQWRTYFAAASADDAAKRATDAGGTLVAGPFDIFDSGRMAIAQDPQGAVFGIWQAKQRIGYRIVSEPGALTWNELVTTDPEQAASFYAGVFNVSTEKMPGPMDYHAAQGGGAAGGGHPAAHAGHGAHAPLLGRLLHGGERGRLGTAGADAGRHGPGRAARHPGGGEVCGAAGPAGRGSSASFCPTRRSGTRPHNSRGSPAESRQDAAADAGRAWQPRTARYRHPPAYALSPGR